MYLFRKSYHVKHLFVLKFLFIDLGGGNILDIWVHNGQSRILGKGYAFKGVSL